MAAFITLTNNPAAGRTTEENTEYEHTHTELGSYSSDAQTIQACCTFRLTGAIKISDFYALN